MSTQDKENFIKSNFNILPIQNGSQYYVKYLIVVNYTSIKLYEYTASGNCPFTSNNSNFSVTTQNIFGQYASKFTFISDYDFIFPTVSRVASSFYYGCTTVLSYTWCWVEYEPDWFYLSIGCPNDGGDGLTDYYSYRDRRNGTYELSNGHNSNKIYTSLNEIETYLLDTYDANEGSKTPKISVMYEALYNYVICLSSSSDCCLDYC